MSCRTMAYVRRTSLLLGAFLLTSVGSSTAWAQTPMTPEAFFGHPVGADYHLTTYERAMEWFDLHNRAQMVANFKILFNTIAGG